MLKGLSSQYQDCLGRFETKDEPHCLRNSETKDSERLTYLNV